MKKRTNTRFGTLKKVFSKLMSPTGCMWDRKQTHSTLIPYLKEETAEFIRAVRKKDYKNMQEELGDILLQVMLHSQIASKNGKFDIEDVIDTLTAKVKRRHPHVFGRIKVYSTKDILNNWEKIKSLEKKDNRAPAER